MQSFNCICPRFKFMIKVAEQETNPILPWLAFPTVTVLPGYTYTAKIAGNVLNKCLYFKCNKSAWAQGFIIHLKQAKSFWGQSFMFSYMFFFFSSGSRWKEECHPSCSVCEWESGPRSVSISLWFSTAGWESINCKEKITEKGNFM